jgi:hypothetical protein
MYDLDFRLEGDSLFGNWELELLLQIAGWQLLLLPQ